MSKRPNDGDTPDILEPPAKKQVTESSKDSSSTAGPFSTLDRPSKPRNLICPHPGCDKTFGRPSRLAVHARSHTGERPFKCTREGCSKSYMEEKHLQQHVTDTHTGERNHACDVDGCGAAFSTGTRLRRHLTTVHADDKAGFKCAEHAPCARRFRKRSALERHVRKDHLGLPPYLCPEDGCSSAYDSAGALRNHKDREHGELKFWCEVCGQDGLGPRVGFTIQSQLENHMRKSHLDCIFCDFTSGSKHDLARHVELQHTGRTNVAEQPQIRCTWDGCDKVFTKRSNLNVHVRSAHEGKRFVCGEVDLCRSEHLGAWDRAGGCGKGFASKANLEDHVRYVHLRMPRPANARRRRGTAEPLDEISGALDASKRSLDCPVHGCVLRFIRNHDLQQHIVKAHASYGGPEPDGWVLPQGSDQETAYGDMVPPEMTQPQASTDPYYPYYPDPGYHGAANTDIYAGGFGADPDPQYAAPQYPHASQADPAAVASQPVDPALLSHTDLENAEFAKQLAAADVSLAPGWNSAQGTLVEA